MYVFYRLIDCLLKQTACAHEIQRERRMWRWLVGGNQFTFMTPTDGINTLRRGFLFFWWLHTCAHHSKVTATNKDLPPPYIIEFRINMWLQVDLFKYKRQNYADRCRAAGKLFAVCAFEVSGGIYLSEMKSVLKRIHRGISERSDISYSAAETRVHQRLSFTLQRSNDHSNRLLPLVVANSASSFYDTKIK